MLLATLCVALLCACNGPVSPKKVCPIPEKIDLSNIGDATLSASFSIHDINWTGGTLKLTLYSKDIYRAEDINALQKGDTLVLGGDEIIITSLKREDNALLVNGGLDAEDGADLEPMEDGTWRSYRIDDYFSFEEIGKVELPFDEDFIITDCGEEPNDPVITVTTGQKAYIDALPDYKKDFSELDTEVQIKDGRVVAIHRIWTP